MKKNEYQIGDLGELGLLERLRSVYKINESSLVAGWDDDTAILPIAGKKNHILLLTSDMLVEGVHFKIATIAPEQLGQKAVRVNLSDIAAMAGQPKSFTVSLGAPPNFPVETLEQIYKGFRKASKKFNVSLCGGDVVKSPVLTISISMVGEFVGNVSKIPLRNNAKEGDSIFLTGTVGDSAAGLKILLSKNKYFKKIAKQDQKFLINRHCIPQPRIEEASALLEKINRFSAIDLSDDLKISLDHITKNSGTGYKIDLENLPLSKKLLRFHKKESLVARKAALYGGEDFELLFTCRQSQNEIKTIFKNAGLKTRVTKIGKITKKEKRILWNGKQIKLNQQSFEHF